MYKQITIVRKDLTMSVGKICSQTGHAQISFLTSLIRNRDFTAPITKRMLASWDAEPQDDWGEIVGYDFEYIFDKDLYEKWIDRSFTKVVLEARNKNHLLKAKTMAEELGMVEGVDFFLICDSCNTELEPEFIDENGIGRTLTCIGFKPMDNKVIDKIGKKYQLYK